MSKVLVDEIANRADTGVVKLKHLSANALYATDGSGEPSEVVMGPNTIIARVASGAIDAIELAEADILTATDVGLDTVNVGNFRFVGRTDDAIGGLTSNAAAALLNEASQPHSAQGTPIELNGVHNILVDLNYETTASYSFIFTAVGTYFVMFKNGSSSDVQLICNAFATGARWVGRNGVDMVGSANINVNSVNCIIIHVVTSGSAGKAVLRHEETI